MIDNTIDRRSWRSFRRPLTTARRWYCRRRLLSSSTRSVRRLVTATARARCGRRTRRSVRGPAWKSVRGPVRRSRLLRSARRRIRRTTAARLIPRFLPVVSRTVRRPVPTRTSCHLVRLSTLCWITTAVRRLLRLSRPVFLPRRVVRLRIIVTSLLVVAPVLNRSVLVPPSSTASVSPSAVLTTLPVVIRLGIRTVV